MESRRQSFYKEYTGHTENKLSTSQGILGKKREKSSENNPSKDLPKATYTEAKGKSYKATPVTKLRRANTLDYEAIGIPYKMYDETASLLPNPVLPAALYHGQDSTSTNTALPLAEEPHNLPDNLFPESETHDSTLFAVEKLHKISSSCPGQSVHLQSAEVSDESFYGHKSASDETALASCCKLIPDPESVFFGSTLPAVEERNQMSSSCPGQSPQIQSTSTILLQAEEPRNVSDKLYSESVTYKTTPPAVEETHNMSYSCPVQSPQLQSTVVPDETNASEKTILQHESLQNLNTSSLTNNLSRDQEIEVCLQEIREEKEEVENITIVLEEIEKENLVVTEKRSEDMPSTSKQKGKKSNIKKINNYKHIDFLSDDESFEWSSSSWDNSTTGDPETSDSRKQKKKRNSKTKRNRKRKNNERNMEEESSMSEKETVISRKKQKRINKAKERSHLMNIGQEYITKSGKVVHAKTLHTNPCTPENCTNECYKILESRRKSIFDHYWSLNKERRKDWLINNSKKEEVKRRRCKDIDSRRHFTHTYYINEGEGKKVVCLKFILNTLDIKQKFLYNTIANRNNFGTSDDDQRGHRVPPNKTPLGLVESVKKYIEELPAVPSHYCRKNSKKLYLPQEFRNLSNLYKIYKEGKRNEGAAFVGEKVFKNIFLKEYNIGFHIPRKDKCQKCIKYENDSNQEFITEKEMHLRDKEETYKRFEVHQNLPNHDDSILCTTFDLQKVLNTPYGESMLLYYSRKLAVYNLTFYESVTRNGFCYTWTEDQGKRGANEVCTILSRYIQEVDNRGKIKRLLLYSDSCPGQNKNRTVLACISKCLNKCRNLTSIQMNYLLPGHTFMPVDSMHSVIEKSVHNTIIWAPSQWATVFELARKNPGPYSVQVLQYKDFEAWDALGGYFKGNLVGKISKVRVATFRKSAPGKMQVKYSMNPDASFEEIDIVSKTDTAPKKIYKAPLPISKKKYEDLVKLCKNKTIPERYHNEYLQLQSSNTVQDLLEASDIEDPDKD